jgi:hypothetical protein
MIYLNIWDDKKMTRELIIVTALLMTSFISTGCTSFSEEEVQLTPNVYGLPLSKLWNITVEKTDLENETAIFDCMMIRIGQDGTIESILMEFYGNKDGKRNWFHVEVNSRGEIVWYSAENRYPALGMHPLYILREVEQIHFSDITFGNQGLIIESDAQWGSLLYEDVFLVNDGLFTPLDVVEFSTDEPWYTIDIFKREAYNTRIIENEKNEEAFISVIVPENDSKCITAFISQDMARAKTIVYNLTLNDP